MKDDDHNHHHNNNGNFDFGFDASMETVSFHCPKCGGEVFLGIALDKQQTAIAIKDHMMVFHGEDISVRPKGTKKWL